MNKKKPTAKPGAKSATAAARKFFTPADWHAGAGSGYLALKKHETGGHLPPGEEQELQELHREHLERDTLTEDGRAHRARLDAMHRRKAELDATAKGATHAERLTLACRWATKIRADAPGVYFSAKGMLRKIADESGIHLSTLRDWYQKGELSLPIEPED